MPARKLLEEFFKNDLWHDGFRVLTEPAGEMARAMFTRSLQTSIDDNYSAWLHPITDSHLENRIKGRCQFSVSSFNHRGFLHPLNQYHRFRDIQLCGGCFSEACFADASSTVDGP
jgi:hypothetical protein